MNHSYRQRLSTIVIEQRKYKKGRQIKEIT